MGCVSALDTPEVVSNPYYTGVEVGKRRIVDEEGEDAKRRMIDEEGEDAKRSKILSKRRYWDRRTL